jgi:hypothetical protein
MLGNKFILNVIAILLAITINSCDKNSSSSQSPFEITVTDTDGLPLEGAIVEGGLDWDSFRVTTDNLGRAVLPEYARDVRATIRKNDHFSLIENYLRPGVYAIAPTPRILTEIGEVEGDLIRFDSSRILTVNYQGEYRVYDFNGHDLTEIVMFEFPHEVKEFKLYGIFFWYTTHQDGIYVYSLADPLNPAEIFHLNIDGYLQGFDVMDSLVAVGPNSGPGPIRLYSFHYDGSATELDRIEDFSANKLYFRSHYLITTGFSTDTFCIFDISDPTDIRFVRRGHYDGFISPYLSGQTLILRANSGNGASGEYGYIMIDLSDPPKPVNFGDFFAEGAIENFKDDLIAAGRYYFDDYALSVFERAPDGNYEAVAMVSEFQSYPELNGADPPYFLMGGKLWKLEQR